MKNANLFYGDYEIVKDTLPYSSYFEFELQYEQCENELNRFLWESRKGMTAYKNRYFGAVVIDLSKWNNNVDKAFFEAFQYFLLDITNELTFILDDEPSVKLLDSLKKRFNISIKKFHLTKQTNENKRIGFYCEEEKDNVRS